MHSYLNSPSPTIGFFAAGLSSAITIGTRATKAAAPAALINVLRDVLFMFGLSRKMPVICLTPQNRPRIVLQAHRAWYNSLDTPQAERIISRNHAQVAE